MKSEFLALSYAKLETLGRNRMKSLPSHSWTSHVKLRQLRLLSQLKESGSLLEAADALGMSQSAASKLLSGLEEEVGVPLFERHARGVMPTPYGEIFVRRAQAALQELTRAAEEISNYRSGARVPVSIGSLLSPSATYLPIAILRLAREAPELLINVEIDTSRHLIEGLSEGHYDLIVARVRDASREPELAFEPLVAEPFRVIARRQHPLARKRGLGLEDLARYTWILPPVGSDLRARVDALYVQNGLPVLTSVVETVSLPVMMGVLLNSDALVLLPEEFAKPFCAAGLWSNLQIDVGVRAENYGIITRRHHSAAPQVRRIAKVFREAAVAVWGTGVRIARK
jgi:DNA-binding transcriptional LysR family regulator